MHIDFIRESHVSFSKIENFEDVRSIRVWYCKCKTLKEISRFPNLEELVIASLPDDSLDILSSNRKLRYLSILHLPKVSDLGGLLALRNIEVLSLATSPAWDAARKCSTVNSIEPIASLGSLRHLELFGVCPVGKSLVPLEKCEALETARFSQYPLDEVERFYSVSKVINAFNPGPSLFTI